VRILSTQGRLATNHCPAAESGDLAKLQALQYLTQRGPCRAPRSNADSNLNVDMDLSTGVHCNSNEVLAYHAADSGRLPSRQPPST
jgi:hypothetical protein